MNNIQAIKTLIETQKNLISKNYNKYSENINLPQDVNYTYLKEEGACKLAPRQSLHGSDLVP